MTSLNLRKITIIVTPEYIRTVEPIENVAKFLRRRLYIDEAGNAYVKLNKNDLNGFNRKIRVQQFNNTIITNFTI